MLNFDKILKNLKKLLNKEILKLIDLINLHISF